MTYNNTALKELLIDLTDELWFKLEKLNANQEDVNTLQRLVSQIKHNVKGIE